MFKNKLNIINAVKNKIWTRYTSTSKVAKPEWDLLCGLCLERKPVISRPLSKLESDFKQMLQEIEIEKSKKSQHEIRHEMDIKRLEGLKKGKLSTEDIEKIIGQTATEVEDTGKKKLSAFVSASKITEADKENNMKSLDRKLDKHLLYLIKENIGQNMLWILPHDTVKKTESLRIAAERILREKCGVNIKAKFYGNAPCGVYKYKYPKIIREDSNSKIGAKIFFMKAQYLNGQIEESNIPNYIWASREELSKQLTHSYYKAINLFLIDDEYVNEEQI
ncbi:hypothetical protein PGB90_007375 [Kerria lacca]